MEKLSNEMMKASADRQKELTDQINKEKDELKLEWTKLQQKIKGNFIFFQLDNFSIYRGT